MFASRALRWILGIIGLVAVLALLLIAFVYSGIYNVGADYPDWPPAAWVLGNITDHSVHRHAAGIKVPPLDNPATIRSGLAHYKEDCVICHGAPGVEIGEVGRGLMPSPPKLTEVAEEWKPNELFWFTKHGVRMTGMPAWGKSVSDRELWDIVAFVKNLPKTTPAQYKSTPPEKEP